MYLCISNSLFGYDALYNVWKKGLGEETKHPIRIFPKECHWATTLWEHHLEGYI